MTKISPNISNGASLVLSNATTFFSGNLEKLFKKAKKYGFKYVEIAPYWWSQPEQILKLQEKYSITVAGIHLPFTNWRQTFRRELRQKTGLWNKITTIIFRVYLGDPTKSPSLKIMELLAETKPYLLIHSDIAAQMGELLAELKNKFHVVIENIPGDKKLARGGVFDHNHFILSLERFPNLNLLKIYGEAKPEIIHISYDNLLPASLPNDAQQKELKQLLQIHEPRYITLETTPLVSIRKAKLLLEKILNPVK